MNKLPEKFIIPKERIPKAWSQGLYNCCVAASITKVLEVINYVKTGAYTMYSKGYTYGKHSRPDKTQGGMGYEYAMDSLLRHGTVPEGMFPIMDEIPYIIERVKERPELDKEAEKTKIAGFTKIKGDIHFYDNVKKCLYEKQMPLVGNMVGKRHCTVIVGWEGNQLLYQDHDGRDGLIRGKFNEAYYLEGDNPSVGRADRRDDVGIVPYGTREANEKEETEMGFKLMDVSEFKNYLDGLNITRKINIVQLHHTYSPSYEDFTGANHIKLQEGMKNYHIKERNYDDIAQQFTIFPDGKICTGRDINIAPAGIYGANSNGICIECLGNFDTGGDTMTEAQKNSIVAVTKILLNKFNLNAADDVTYHCWWASDGREIGDYYKGVSTKTCPGTNFFGGNGLTAYRNNLQPLIENYGKIMLESGNDIVWELMNGKYKIEITEVQRAIKAIDEAKKNAEFSSLYWILYKLVNK